MNIRILTKKNELIYFTAYIIWTAWYVIFKSSLYGENMFNGNSKKLLLGLCAVLLIYKMIYIDKYKIKEIDIIVVISIITCISSYISKDEMPVMVLLFIIASKNIPFKKIVKVTFIEILLLVLFIALACKLGMLENFIYHRADGAVRNSFGFKYTLFLGAYYLNMVLIYLYLKNKDIKYYEYIIILIMNFYIYNQTDNRTVYILVYFCIALAIILNKIKFPDKLNWLINQIFAYCVPFFAVLSIGLSLFYNKSNIWFVYINKVLEGRLSLGKRAYLDFGLDFFGNNIKMVGNGGADFYNGNISKLDYNYIDNSYLQIAIRYGITLMIIICIAYVFLCIKEVKKHNIIFCICILTIVIQGIINDQFILPPYNVFILALGELLSKNGNFYAENNFITGIHKNKLY